MYLSLYYQDEIIVIVWIEQLLVNTCRNMVQASTAHVKFSLVKLISQELVNEIFQFNNWQFHLEVPTRPTHDT